MQRLQCPYQHCKMKKRAQKTNKKKVTMVPSLSFTGWLVFMIRLTLSSNNARGLLLNECGGIAALICPQWTYMCIY